MVQSTLASFSSIAVAIALVIIVSRLLPPDVVGSFVMAFAIVFFIDQLREFQLPSYVARLQEVNAEALGAIRAVALVTSGLAIVATLIAAALFTHIFGEQAVGNSLAIMALGFVLRPWSQPAMALLSRDLRYGAIAAIRLLASATRLFVSVWLIIDHEMGAEALAWGVVAEFTVEAAGIFLIPVAQRFAAPGTTGLQEAFLFCSRFTLATTLIQVSVAAAPLLIGGYHGHAMAALYNRGTAVTRLLRSGVERAVLLIAMTQFSRASGDLARLKSSYLSGIGMLTSVSWPALASFALLADPVILILFGEEWRGAALLAQVLALASIVFAAGALSHQVHAALDRTDTILKREAIIQSAQVAMLFATAPISAMALVYGMLGISFVTLAFQLRLLREEIALRAGEYLASLWRSAAVTLITLAAAFGARAMIDHWPRDFAYLAVMMGVIATSWLGAAFIVRSPLIAEFRQLFRNDA